MMTKEAKTTYPVHALIKDRWSPRAFSNKTLKADHINTLLEAASWAPSAMNEQPWHYIYALKDTPGFDAIVDCLLPGNKPWAKNAAALMISVGYKYFEKTGQLNLHYMHDCGLANANLLTQALSMNIYGHLMGGFDRSKTVQTFGLQENEEPICFIALGYLGNPEELPEPFKTRETTPRSRKDLSTFSIDKSFLF